MVERIEKTYESSEIGNVRLDASELLKILRENVTEDEYVKIEANGFRINDLEDLQSNISLIEGFPDIEISRKNGTGSLSIHFLRISTRVSSHGCYVESKHAKYKKILEKYATWSNWIDQRLWAITLILTILTSAILINDNQLIDHALLVVLTLIIATMLLAGADMFVIKNGVIYAPRQGFLRRNIDKIIVGVIVAGVSAALTALTMSVM